MPTSFERSEGARRDGAHGGGLGARWLVERVYGCCANRLFCSVPRIEPLESKSRLARLNPPNR